MIRFDDVESRVPDLEGKSIRPVRFRVRDSAARETSAVRRDQLWWTVDDVEGNPPEPLPEPSRSGFFRMIPLPQSLPSDPLDGYIAPGTRFPKPFGCTR